MFRVLTPTALPLPSSYAAHDAEAASSRDLMQVDEDPAFPTASTSRIAIPGEPVASAQEWMRGHGSYVENDYIISSVAGQVERVNKLVSVRPFRSKYRPEVGDLVIGRITEVGPRRWRVEVDGRIDAILMLSSINLPGGVQRRKLESDELQMRTFFQEGDLLVAELQSIMGEGTMSLHTRSLKYGKLRNGRLAIVPPTLVVRLKSHFHSLSYGVEMIVGLNGYVWIQAPSALSKGHSASAHAPGDDWQPEASASMAIYSGQNDAIDADTRDKIDRTAACAEILAKHWIAITLVNIQAAYKASLQLQSEDGLQIQIDHLHLYAKSIIESIATPKQ